DTTPPSGQTISHAGVPYYQTPRVPLTTDNGTDDRAGLDPASGTVERADATLADGSCGSFGAFQPVTLDNGTDTTAASGHCYRYRYSIADNVGNRSTPSPTTADAKVDSALPTVTVTAPTELTGAGDQHYDAA